MYICVYGSGSIEVELTVCCVVMMLNQISLVSAMSSGYDRQLSVASSRPGGKRVTSVVYCKKL
jgi:hypothetical protein